MTAILWVTGCTELRKLHTELNVLYRMVRDKYTYHYTPIIVTIKFVDLIKLEEETSREEGLMPRRERPTGHLLPVIHVRESSTRYRPLVHGCQQIELFAHQVFKIRQEGHLPWCGVQQQL